MNALYPYVLPPVAGITAPSESVGLHVSNDVASGPFPAMLVPPEETFEVIVPVTGIAPVFCTAPGSESVLALTGILLTYFFLLPVALPAVFKFALTFIFSLTLSWLVTALLRQIPLIKKFI